MGFGIVAELRCMVSYPFDALSDVLRILTAEVLDDKRIGCIEGLCCTNDPGQLRAGRSGSLSA